MPNHPTPSAGSGESARAEALIKLADVPELRGLDNQQRWRLVRRHGLRAIKLGRCFYVYPSDLRQFIEARRVTPKAVTA